MPLLGPYEAAAAGLAAGVMSLPHCAAMCGPVSSFVCTRSGHPKAQWGYQAGRMLGYGFAGSLAGQFGLVVSEQLPTAGQHRLLAVVTALALLGLAVRLLPRRTTASVVPTQRLTRNAPSTPSWHSRFLDLLPRSATVLGGLSTLLPCGALLSGLLLAAGSGNGLGGAIVMTSFAIASAPALWASSWLGGVLTRLQSRSLRLAIAATLVAAGTFLLIPRSVDPQAASATDDTEACH